MSTARLAQGRGLGRAVQLLVLGVAVVAGLLLVAGPVLTTIGRSFVAADSGPVQLTFQNFVKLAGDAGIRQAALNTLIAGAATTFFSTLLGTALAWVVTRTDIPGRRFFSVFNLVPFFLSPYVGAMSWLYLAAPHAGILQKLALQNFGSGLDWLNLYSVPGVIWVLSLFYTPYVYLLVIGPLRSMDGALEDAARVHGASFWMTMRRITLPLLLPALLSGALIVFVTSAGLFDVPLALASPRGIHMLPTEIYAAVQYPSDFGRASALGALMMTVTILFAVLQQRYIGRRRFDTISGKGYRPRPVRLGPLGRAAALGFEIVYLGASVVLPICALLLVALSRLWTGLPRFNQMTVGNFDYVLFNYSLTQTALSNSVFLAVAGATVGVTLGCLQAYYVQRRSGWISRVVAPVLSLPLGIPGIIVGLGFLVLLIGTPLYSTIWILLIAYVAHFFPFALRGVSAMLVAMNPELEQSARAHGASWAQTMRYVMVPLLRPALFATWLMLFVIFIRELGSTILLYAQGTETISVALVVLSDRNFGYVAALAIAQLVLLLGAFFLFGRSGAEALER
jgi:iron(III) transport system permease protein